MAFGVLQDYTDYQYCCGASKDLLNTLGANYDDTCKPDAILIDRRDGQYVMAEWKKCSADFKVNQSREDVDILMRWHDNELNRSLLPPVVVALHAVAKKVAGTMLGAE